ncbi:MAG: hypothetical protein ACI9OJ_005909, partial [Myxococcota bacterium]
DPWVKRWAERLGQEDGELSQRADAMDRVNPLYIPRNHKVEEALQAASQGSDLGPFERLLEAVTKPFEKRPGLEEYEGPAPQDFGPYVTYCGT